MLLWLLACNTYTQAGGFQVQLQGQKANGMAHIGTAVPLGASSVYFNPGALGYVNGTRISAGVSPLLANVSVLHPQTGATSAKETSIGTPLSLFFSTSLGKSESNSALSRLRLGLGIYTPFGSAISYPDDWIGRYLVQSVDLKTFYIQPTVAYAINEYVSLGAGFVYGLGKFTINRAIPLANSQGVDGQAKLSGSGGGIGFNAGILIRPTPRLSVGVSYISAGKVSISDGKTEFTVPQSVAPLFPNTSFSSSITLPNQLLVGVAYYFNVENENFISVQMDRAGWGVFKELRFDYAQPVAGEEYLAEPRNYEANYVFRVGGQAKATQNLVVRAGAFYDTASAPDCCVTPEVPDTDKYGGSIGLTYSPIENLDIDLSFMLVQSKQRTTTNAYSGFTATYAGHAYIPGIGIEYKF